MPVYETTTIDDRGQEPIVRIRQEVTDANNLVRYRLTQSDLERVVRFPLESVALNLFGDEDLAWILHDVNDQLIHPKDLQVGDFIFIPKNWESIATTGRKQQSPGRSRR